MRSVRNIRIQDLISNIEDYSICNGINEDNPTTGSSCCAQKKLTLMIQAHLNIIPSHFTDLENCFLLHHSGDKCSNCLLHEKDNYKKIKRKIKMINTPASKYAPLSKTHPNRRILALQQKCKKIEADLPLKGVTLDAKNGC